MLHLVGFWTRTLNISSFIFWLDNLIFIPFSNQLLYKIENENSWRRKSSLQFRQFQCWHRSSRLVSSVDSPTWMRGHIGRAQVMWGPEPSPGKPRRSLKLHHCPSSSKPTQNLVGWCLQSPSAVLVDSKHEAPLHRFQLLARWDPVPYIARFCLLKGRIEQYSKWNLDIASEKVFKWLCASSLQNLPANFKCPCLKHCSLTSQYFPSLTLQSL